MDVELIKQLMQLMAQSQVVEMEYEASDIRLKLKREDSSSNNTLYPRQIVAPQPVSDREIAPHDESEEPTPADIAIVKSPIVGTFYLAPAPGADPFVSVGDYIRKGQTLCIIEAMKVMNEIESDFDGRVSKILIEDSQPVEFGQYLMWVEPSS
ncbi:acetyl-CoA carboxylase biotin carboxyl carrier protein [bacterium]|nr:acetyl-CoA carboxylase biotin carboxyl carrier protein [bacterium]